MPCHREDLDQSALMMWLYLYSICKALSICVYIYIYINICVSWSKNNHIVVFVWERRWEHAVCGCIHPACLRAHESQTEKISLQLQALKMQLMAVISSGVNLCPYAQHFPHWLKDSTPETLQQLSKPIICCVGIKRWALVIISVFIDSAYRSTQLLIPDKCSL